MRMSTEFQALADRLQNAMNNQPRTKMRVINTELLQTVESALRLAARSSPEREEWIRRASRALSKHQFGTEDAWQDQVYMAADVYDAVEQQVSENDRANLPV